MTCCVTRIRGQGIAGIRGQPRTRVIKKFTGRVKIEYERVKTQFVALLGLEADEVWTWALRETQQLKPPPPGLKAKARTSHESWNRIVRFYWRGT